MGRDEGDEIRKGDHAELRPWEELWIFLSEIGLTMSRGVS